MSQPPPPLSPNVNHYVFFDHVSHFEATTMHFKTLLAAIIGLVSVATANPIVNRDVSAPGHILMNRGMSSHMKLPSYQAHVGNQSFEDFRLMMILDIGCDSQFCPCARACTTNDCLNSCANGHCANTFPPNEKGYIDCSQ